MKLLENSQHKFLARSRVWSVLLMAVAAFLLLWNLRVYPLPWFDEGLNFQVPKNLILHGQYAMLSSEGFRVLDPALQTGLPVTLPIALSFRVLGIGLLQARLVTSLFGILCVVAYYRIAERLYNRTVGWLAVLLLLTFAAESFVSFPYMGRQVLGEVPALFFLLSGLLVWFRSWERVELHYLFGAGLLFGLAMLAKSQFTLLVLPTVLVIWLVGFGFRILRWRHLVLPAALPIGMALVWYVCQMAILGLDQFFLNVAALRVGMRLHVLNFSPATMRTSIGVLFRSGFILWGGLGLGYALWRVWSLPRNQAMLRRLALLAFAGIWLVWYVFASIGWARYAFVVVAVSHMFFAALLYDALVALFRRGDHMRISFAIAIALLLIAGWMVFSGHSTVSSILLSDDNSYFQFARYLNESVPPDVVVESWEWELDLVTSLRFHHPPTRVVNMATRRLWGDKAGGEVTYDVCEFAPEYLVIGPFARWTGLYDEVGLIEKAGLQGSFGQYDLYQVSGCNPLH